MSRRCQKLSGHLINVVVLDLLFIMEGELYIKFHLYNEEDNSNGFSRQFTVGLKMTLSLSFLAKLVRAC